MKERREKFVMMTAYDATFARLISEAGAETIIVTGLEADARKLALAREFGADHTIDVENENAVARIRELTDGIGARVVVDVSSYSTTPVAEAPINTIFPLYFDGSILPVNTSKKESTGNASRPSTSA